MTVKERTERVLDRVPAKVGAVDQVCNLIRQRIGSGRYVPGQRLVIRDLEEQMGFSRSTFREALRRLEAEKLVNLVPNVGASVQKVTRGELADLFQLSEILQAFAAELAATRIGMGDNRRRLMEVRKKNARSGLPERQQFIEQTALFFKTIYDLSGNSRLEDTLRHLQVDLVLAYWRQVMSYSDIELAVQDQEGIIEAVLNGETKKAADRMQAYLHRNQERTLEYFERAYA